LALASLFFALANPRSLRYMDGELYFYTHVPAPLRHYFPALHDHSRTAGPEPSVAITVEKIDGITYSHLLLNACVTPGRLRKVLDALSDLHAWEGGAGEDEDLDLCSVRNTSEREEKMCLNSLELCRTCTRRWRSAS
jgi:hypothetical protein